MIRIAVDLVTAIETQKPGWAARAAIRTASLDGDDDPDFNNEWSDIKQAFIALQHSKCAFCEKPLEGVIEQDVEHYRPKGAVVRWPVPPDLAEEIRVAGFRVVQAALRQRPRHGQTIRRRVPD